MAYTIDHEDIWIESTETLSWRKKYNDALNYENLSINTHSYADYQPTRLQFVLTSAVQTQEIKVKIKYANRLTRTHVKYAVVCRYNPSTKEWETIKHSVNTADKTLEFESTVVGVFGVFINHYWYSELTQRMADEYPNWTEIRNSAESTGQQFLNYFGMELETVQDYLEWIREQKYITTADMSTFDWVNMYQLPDISVTDTVAFTRKVNSSDVEVPILETLKDFFYNQTNHGGIIDYEENRYYTKRSYGRLTMTVTKNGITTKSNVTPMVFHIWNTFDEFGLLLGVERLHLEKNEDYKERLLDVFRYPSGTNDMGLTNGIARSLKLIQRKDRNGNDLMWSNDSKSMYLKNTTGKIIDTRTLQVDDKILTEEEFTVDERGNILIFARNEGKPHKVSFIYGVDKYQLYKKTDESLYQMMYKEDGQATSKLLTWVEYINTIAPIMWDRFNWDEGFWDTIDKDLTGLGYIPNVWDSDIEVWKDYIFESDR
jgi:hypothetical protein